MSESHISSNERAAGVSSEVVEEDGMSTAFHDSLGITEVLPPSEAEAEQGIGSFSEAFEEGIGQPDDSSDEPTTAWLKQSSSVVPIGAIDEVMPERITGWAWHPNQPDEPIDVRLLVDDAPVLELRADQFRPDLEGRMGNGRHGFVVQDLATHLSPGTHSVRVRRAIDDLDLPGSPSWVTRPDSSVQPAIAIDGLARTRDRQAEPALRSETPAIGNVDIIDYARISGWAWDPTKPDEPIDIEILDGDEVVLTVRADRFRADLRERNVGDGIHGFDIRNLAGAFPLSRHLVRVRRQSDQLDLPGSPHWITRPGFDGNAVSFMERAVFSAIQVATTSEDLAQPLTTLLQLLNDLVNVHDGLRSTGAPPAIDLIDNLNLGALAN